MCDELVVLNWYNSDLDSIQGREVCLYSISAKNNVKIDVTLNWLIQHANQTEQ